MKRNDRRLTFRIFCVTLGLLLSVGVIFCGMLVWLTPMSYTAMLDDALARESQALLDRLGRLPMAESERALNEFSRKTGAYYQLIDAEGDTLWVTLPDQAFSVQVNIATMQETQATSTQADETWATAENVASASEQADTAVIDAVVIQSTAIEETVTQVTESASAAPIASYWVAFADGQQGELMIQGGTKAVNQAVEVLKRMLPLLLGVILCVSLLGASIYAVLITRPIIALSALAGRMASLDFSARWHGKRRDEIGALGESLNALCGNLSTALDQLRDANAALQADMAREKALEAQRTAFFAAASHELKTPITILKGQLSGMLAQVGVYRDREKYLGRALAVTGRMERLIGEILVISKIESSAFTVGEETIDFSALVRAQWEADAPMLTEKRFITSVYIAPDICVTGNRHLLAHALDNIYMNAILYSPEGASIRLTLTREALRLENTGVHVPEDQLENLFTPFFRVDPSRSRRTGGSGLGLYLAKSIFALHGMACAIHNTREGVCFTAELGRR